MNMGSSPAAISLYAAATTVARAQQPQLPSAAMTSIGTPVCYASVAPPPPTPMVRSQTAPPAVTTFAPGNSFEGGMSLCFVGDPGQPFADFRNPPAAGGLIRARTSSEHAGAMYMTTPVSTPMVRGQLLGTQSLGLRPSSSSVASQMSVLGSPMSSAPTPINLDHWQTVGERLANVFADPSLLSSPSASPMAASSGTVRRSFAEPGVLSPTGASSAFGRTRTLSQGQASAFFMPATGQPSRW